MEQTINYPGWEIVREIGTGSYGKVYEIKKENSFAATENSALKVISIPPKNLDIQSYSEEMGLDEESFSAMVRNQMESITKEFSLMSQLKGNSNIVSYEDHSVVEHKGEPGWDIYIRMELLTPLTDYLRNNSEIGNSVDESFVVKLGTDICKALTVCENHHIVHRDIKPQNIFINKDGNFKLGDFGIAKNAENVTIGTRTGTFNYMAPEVYNNKPYGSSVDIYSLGLVMYWLLNERRAPFLPLFPAVPTTSDFDTALTRRIRGDEIPAPKNGSETIKKIVLKAIQYDPKKRYLSATEMLKDLTDNYENGIQKAKPEKQKKTLKKSKSEKALSNNADSKIQAQGKDKKKSKKIIILALVAVLVISLVVIVPRVVKEIMYSTESPYPEVTPYVSMLIGCNKTDSLPSDDYQEITVNGQTVEVNVLPKEIEMSHKYENILFLTYTDRYDYEYYVYGTVSIYGNSLTVAPCDKIDGIGDDTYPVAQTLEYYIDIAPMWQIELHSNGTVCSYHNYNTDTGILMLNASADGEMYENIESVNIVYYPPDATTAEGAVSPDAEPKCQIVFSDGSYTLDATVNSYYYGHINITWNKKMIQYNGREEIEESYGATYFDYLNNDPEGFIIIDSDTGKTYVYQSEPVYIEEQSSGVNQ